MKSRAKVAEGDGTRSSVQKASTLGKAKLFVAATVALILIILIVQNREDVDIQLLVVTVTMPRALLIALTALIGFAIGVLTSLAFSRQGKGQAKSPPVQH